LVRKWAGRRINVEDNGEKLLTGIEETNMDMAKNKIQFDFKKKRDNQTNWISANFNGGQNFKN